MSKRITGIVFSICVVVIFTAQVQRPEEKGQQRGPVRAAPVRTSPARTTPVHNNQNRPRPPAYRAAPSQVVRREQPAEQSQLSQRVPRPERSGPRVYAVPAPVLAGNNNRLLHRHHHNHWQPLYNFYDNQYQFYPYVNVASPVELSADYASVQLNGQPYFYDRGSFYVQDPQGYLATPPPIGIIVSALPPHARPINVDGQIFYRYKGVFYAQVAQGYQVIAPVQSGTGGS